MILVQYIHHKLPIQGMGIPIGMSDNNNKQHT